MSDPIEVTYSYLYSTGYTELHKRGCRAAKRRTKHPSGALIETDTRDSTLTVEEWERMLNNPDEAYIKRHNCLKGVLR